MSRFASNWPWGWPSSGLAGVGTAAIAHDRSRFNASLTGYEEVPTLSTAGRRLLPGVDQPRPGRDPLHAQLPRAVRRAAAAGASRRRTSTSARGPSTAASSRSCAANLGNGPAGTPAVPGRGHGERDDHAGAGDRADAPGHRARRVRRARACAARRRGLRQRAHDRERRAARSAARSPPTTTITTATLSPHRAPAHAGALSFRRVADDKRMRLRGLHHVTAICRDLERTIAFYRDMLGLAIVHDAPSDDDPDARHVWFGAGDGTLVSFMEYPRDAGGRGRHRLHAPLRAARRLRRGAGGVARLPARARRRLHRRLRPRRVPLDLRRAIPTATSSRSPRAGPASAPAGRPPSGPTRRRRIRRRAHAVRA